MSLSKKSNDSMFTECFVWDNLIFFGKGLVESGRV